MRSMRAVIAVTAAVMVGLIAIPTSGVADEQLRITGEAREVKFDGSQLQIIPTEKGVFIVAGALVKGKPGNVVLLEGAQPAQVKVARHHHADVLVVHREFEALPANQVHAFHS
jgi:hypothetical protein